MIDYVTDSLRHAGKTKRYHTWPVLQSQTVAEHSWQIALIYEQLWGNLSPPVERFIRLHDVPEIRVGDIPFPTKAKNPSLKAEFDKVEEQALKDLGIKMPVIAKDIRTRIKICDLLEMMFFGMNEREMGNMYAVPIIVRTRDAALKLASEKLPNDFQLVNSFVHAATRRHNETLGQQSNVTEWKGTPI